MKIISQTDEPSKTTEGYDSPPVGKTDDGLRDDEMGPDAANIEAADTNIGGMYSADGYAGSVAQVEMVRRDSTLTPDPVGPPPIASPPQHDPQQPLPSMIDTMPPPPPHSGYDGYMTGPPPPSSPYSRRSPGFSSAGLFQVSS